MYITECHIIATCFLKNNLRTFGFALGPWAIYSQVLGHLCNVRYGLHLMEWVLSRIRHWLVTPTLCVPPMH